MERKEAMRFLTMGTPEHCRKHGDRLRREIGRESKLEVIGLTGLFMPRIVKTIKPTLIMDYLLRTNEPLWWIDLDDHVTGAFSSPPDHVRIGMVRNQECSVIKTELPWADCLHYWTPTQQAYHFLETWKIIATLAPNQHRALMGAYYCAAVPRINENLSGVCDVTACVAGRFTMSGRGNRPEARL